METDPRKTGVRGLKSVTSQYNNKQQEKPLTATDLRNIQLARKARLYEKTTAPVQDVSAMVDPTFGESRYDEGVRNILDASNGSLQDIRAENQSGWAKIGLGLAKMVPTAVTTLASLVALPFGGYNTEIQEEIAQWQNEIDNMAPIYRTRDQEKHPLAIRNIFSSQFLGNFIQQYGFQIATGIITGGVSWLGTSLLKGLAKSAPKTVKALNMLLSSTVGAAGEATIEANQAKLQAEQKWLQGFDSEYQDKLYSLVEKYNGDVNNPNFLKEAVDLENRYNEATSNIKDSAKSVADKTFILNMGILTLSNIFGLGAAYRKGFDTELRQSYIKKLVNDEVLNYEAKNLPKWARVLKAVKTPLVEGSEEFFQGTASSFSTNYYEDRLKGRYIDKKSENDMKDWFTTLKDTLTEQVEDQNAWLEFLSGAIMGTIGSPTLKGWQGSIFQEWRKDSRQQKRNAQTTKTINDALNNLGIAGVKDRYSRVAKLVETQNAIDEALQNGDRKLYNDAVFQQLGQLAGAFKQSGRLDDLKEIFNTDDLTDEQIQDIIDKTTSTIGEEKLSNIQEAQKESIDASVNEGTLGYVQAEEEKQKVQDAVDELKKTQTGPFIKEDGSKMSVQEAKQVLKNNSERMNKIINSYAEYYNNLDMQTKGVLTDEELNTLVMMHMQYDNWRERLEALDAKMPIAIKEALQLENDTERKEALIKHVAFLSPKEQVDFLNMVNDRKLIMESMIATKPLIEEYLDKPNKLKEKIAKQKENLAEEQQETIKQKDKDTLRNMSAEGLASKIENLEVNPVDLKETAKGDAELEEKVLEAQRLANLKNSILEYINNNKNPSYTEEDKINATNVLSSIEGAITQDSISNALNNYLLNMAKIGALDINDAFTYGERINTFIKEAITNITNRQQEVSQTVPTEQEINNTNNDTDTNPEATNVVENTATTDTPTPKPPIITEEDLDRKHEERPTVDPIESTISNTFLEDNHTFDINTIINYIEEKGALKEGWTFYRSLIKLCTEQLQDWKIITDSSKKQSRTYYAKKTIVLADDFFGRAGKDPDYIVIAHELLHAILHSKFVQYKNNKEHLSEQERIAIEELGSLLEIARSRLRSSNYDPVTMSVLNYATQNIDEFVACLTEPIVREVLKRESIWAKIVDCVKKIYSAIFNKEQEEGNYTESNLYKESVSALNQLLNNYTSSIPVDNNSNSSSVSTPTPTTTSITEGITDTINIGIPQRSTSQDKKPLTSTYTAMPHISDKAVPGIIVPTPRSNSGNVFTWTREAFKNPIDSIMQVLENKGVSKDQRKNAAAIIRYLIDNNVSENLTHLKVGDKVHFRKEALPGITFKVITILDSKDRILGVLPPSTASMNYKDLDKIWKARDINKVVAQVSDINPGNIMREPNENDLNLVSEVVVNKNPKFTIDMYGNTKLLVPTIGESNVAVQCVLPTLAELSELEANGKKAAKELKTQIINIIKNLHEQQGNKAIFDNITVELNKLIRVHNLQIKQQPNVTFPSVTIQYEQGNQAKILFDGRPISTLDLNTGNPDVENVANMIYNELAKNGVMYNVSKAQLEGDNGNGNWYSNNLKEVLKTDIQVGGGNHTYNDSFHLSLIQEENNPIGVSTQNMQPEINSMSAEKVNTEITESKFNQEISDLFDAPLGYVPSVSSFKKQTELQNIRMLNKHLNGKQVRRVVEAASHLDPRVIEHITTGVRDMSTITEYLMEFCNDKEWRFILSKANNSPEEFLYNEYLDYLSNPSNTYKELINLFESVAPVLDTFKNYNVLRNINKVIESNEHKKETGLLHEILKKIPPQMTLDEAKRSIERLQKRIILANCLIAHIEIGKSPLKDKNLTSKIKEIVNSRFKDYGLEQYIVAGDTNSKKWMYTITPKGYIKIKNKIAQSLKNEYQDSEIPYWEKEAAKILDNSDLEHLINALDKIDSYNNIVSEFSKALERKTGSFISKQNKAPLGLVKDHTKKILDAITGEDLVKDEIQKSLRSFVTCEYSDRIDTKFSNKMLEILQNCLV